MIFMGVFFWLLHWSYIVQKVMGFFVVKPPTINQTTGIPSIKQICVTIQARIQEITLVGAQGSGDR